MERAAGATIEVDDLAVHFGDLEVFSGLHLRIDAGEVVSVVGPSGCGKTTLLRTIAGLTQPSGGEVRIDGQVVAGPSEGVAMVFQQFGLFPWKTVRANVAYGLRQQGVKGRELAEVVDPLIKMVGLEGFENAYPHQLSGGMQQRAGLARALAVRPRVMLMDEPFGALDAQTREVLQFEMLRIRRLDGSSMVFVTHAIDEAVLFGHRVVVLGGRPSRIREIVEVDLPAERDREITRSEKFLDLREHIWSLVMGNSASEPTAATADV